jgi:hypothetical protein
MNAESAFFTIGNATLQSETFAYGMFFVKFTPCFDC